jgi:hypothetical protein
VQLRYKPTANCNECATDPTHWPDLQRAGCTKDMIPHLCGANFDTCEAEVKKVCGSSIGQKNACYSCLKANTHEMEMADCTDVYAEYACTGGGHHSSKWETYIEELSCHMHGNW